MRKVSRNEIVSVAEYEKLRTDFRAKILQIKECRRIHVGEHLTFLFENKETVRYQIQEMIRAEGMKEENQIAHEIETYNELLGEQGELGCTLLIEIDDPQRRSELLSRWLNLPEHLYVKTADGAMVRPVIDERQIGESRISSVHYLRFKLADKVPAAVGCSHADINTEVSLSKLQTSELCKDLMAR
ncbi:MAG: hypothetical protein RLZZ488_1044 [Pseudomonadota bacterium]|jgi:hypothetical protein